MQRRLSHEAVRLYLDLDKLDDEKELPYVSWDHS